jgi:DNA modification methylase
MTTPTLDETATLQQIQKESERQPLPAQEKVFAVAKRVRSRLNNLPDPTHPPLGWVKGRAFDDVFPFIRLPELRPALNGDWVQFGTPDLEPNRLYFGDNLQVLRTLPSESIDLIYIDPPFFSGAEYNTIWGDANEVRTFNDIWDGGIDTYLVWLNARLWEMRRVLRSTGSIFVHCDWHASHYIKTEMDKIFGYEQFVNEIVWMYKTGGMSKRWFGRKHDVILMYAKDDARRLFDPQKEKSFLSHKYGFSNIEIKSAPCPFVHEDATDAMALYTDVGMRDVWDIPALRGNQPETIGYPTQKPEAILERVLRASSREGDVVADFFAGGGGCRCSSAIGAALDCLRHFAHCRFGDARSSRENLRRAERREEQLRQPRRGWVSTENHRPWREGARHARRVRGCLSDGPLQGRR